MSKQITSGGRHSRHHDNSRQGSPLLSSPYVILFVMLLSTIGLIVMFHLLPNEHLAQTAAEHNMVRNIKSFNEAQMASQADNPSLSSSSILAERPSSLHQHYQRLTEQHKTIQENHDALEDNSHKEDNNRSNESPKEDVPSSNSIEQQESHGSNFKSSDSRDEHPSAQQQQVQQQQQQQQQQGANKLGMGTVLLIICSNRPDYLKKTLSYVLQYHPRQSVPIVISQDGDNAEVNRVIEEAEKQFKAQSLSSISFEHVHHRADRNVRYENGYFKLADHFKFALNYVFRDRSAPTAAQRVIILEEDLQIAPDFFEYFAATKDLLDNDSTLLAVSAWNDNGFRTLVQDNQMIYRSDFFPGLGWMMTKSLWDELSVKWPRAYWDDWLREPKQRQNRHILRPEVCRTLHFGVHGVSNAQYSEYLESIRLNEEYIKFTELDLSYLSTSRQWDEYYLDHQVRSAKSMSFGQLRSLLDSHSSGSGKGIPSDHLRITYGTYDEGSRAPDSYTTYCHYLGCMNNVKAGVPRTAYKGITTIRKSGYTIHLVPKAFK